ncbi:MAG TPA: glycosyltransferase family 2 protein [Terriglobales bacterium]|nr:glycosyltransferase family 2 protein [Terriglobales bacterium]
MSRPPMIAIIVVTWNGWTETIECLESLLRLNYSRFRVFVCDNGSNDLEYIGRWANGDLPAGCNNPRLQHLTIPPVAKPVPHLSLAAGETIDLSQRVERLLLVQTGANLYYAGGNNVGLRLALSEPEMEFAWLLNNDTVVDANALTHLVRRMEQKPEAGICGSTLLYYDAPEVVQAMGGSTYNAWLARIGQIGTGSSRRDLLPPEKVESQMRYVAGASMFLRRELLEKVGLLDERYRVYFEEIDLATRVRNKYPLAYAPESIVFHKEGAALGTSTLRSRRPSARAQQYSCRNRILFTRIHFPARLAPVLLATLASVFARLLTGRMEEFRASLRGLKSGLMTRLTGQTAASD